MHVCFVSHRVARIGEACRWVLLMMPFHTAAEQDQYASAALWRRTARCRVQRLSSAYCTQTAGLWALSDDGHRQSSWDFTPVLLMQKRIEYLTHGLSTLLARLAGWLIYCINDALDGWPTDWSAGWITDCLPESSIDFWLDGWLVSCWLADYLDSWLAVGSRCLLPVWLSG